jgi:hypothetical protein
MFCASLAGQRGKDFPFLGNWFDLGLSISPAISTTFLEKMLIYAGFGGTPELAARLQSVKLHQQSFH